MPNSRPKSASPVRPLSGAVPVAVAPDSHAALAACELLPELQRGPARQRSAPWAALLATHVSADSPAAKSAEVPALAQVVRQSSPALGAQTFANLDPDDLLACEPPYVGRSNETAVLFEALRNCLNEGGWQAVWLSGAAGTGKTRLATHVRDLLRTVQATFGWVTVECADGMAPPTLAGRVLLRVFGEGLRKRSEVLARIVQHLGAWSTADTAAILEPMVSALLAVPELSPEAVPTARPMLAAQAAELAAAILTRHCRDIPLIVHITVDASSLQQLALLMASAKSYALAESLAFVVEAQVVSSLPDAVEIVLPPHSPTEMTA